MTRDTYNPRIKPTPADDGSLIPGDIVMSICGLVGRVQRVEYWPNDGWRVFVWKQGCRLPMCYPKNDLHLIEPFLFT